MGESLGQFIRRIRKEKRLSCVAVSNQSARFGKRISGSYINRIENEPKIRPTADCLRALANGLGVPPEELFALAIGYAPEGETPEEIELITRFRELSPERRDDLIRIVDLYYQKELT